MAEETTASDEGGTEDSFESPYATERQTAPQSPYTQRDVIVGALIALVGLLVTVALPLALA